MSFFEKLQKRYQEEGFETYSRHIPGSSPAPPGWKGPLPDMVAETREIRTAIFRETEKSLDSKAAERWSAIMENHVSDLRIFVDRPQEKTSAVELLQRYRLPGKVIVIRKRPHLLQAYPGNSPRLGLWLAALLFFLLLSIFLVWLFDAFQGYDPNFYEPRDVEREHP